jgi:NAD(P)-dependent dehydrogenase (short-subunit alcohol dehydrogenase family)
MDVLAWDRVMDANVRGNSLAGFAAARHMNAHGGGRIVFIGSVLMNQSEPRTLAYAASKAALASVVRSMAVDLAKSDISVNGVAPGWVLTAMGDIAHVPPEEMNKINPQGRGAAPEEIAEVVRFLALEAPRFLSGQMLVVDGAQSIRGATL